jgi:hypothetical protein
MNPFTQPNPPVADSVLCSLLPVLYWLLAIPSSLFPGPCSLVSSLPRPLVTLSPVFPPPPYANPGCETVKLWSPQPSLNQALPDRAPQKHSFTETVKL